MKWISDRIYESLVHVFAIPITAKQSDREKQPFRHEWNCMLTLMNVGCSYIVNMGA